MGTGGGWQDQIGGVYPGIKLTTSSPGPQITLKVDPIEVSSELKLALQDRMVVIFTGQVLISSSMLFAPR
jgi:fucokinase